MIIIELLLSNWLIQPVPGLKRIIKYVIHKEKLNAIDTVYEIHILSFLRPAFCENLTWQNLKRLVELVNLTVFYHNERI